MVENSPERRFFQVAFVSSLSTILTIGAQILVVPVCLTYWGKETYGMWIALFSVFTMLRTTGAGFVNYTGNKINLQYHKDKNELQTTLASAPAGVFVILILQAAILVIISTSNGIPSLLGVSEHYASLQVTIAFSVLVATWMLGGPYIAIITRLLIPSGYMYQAQWWALAVQLSIYMVLIVSSLLHFSILQTSIFFAAVRSILLFSSATYTCYKLPEFYPWWKGYNYKHFQRGVGDLWRSVPFTASGLLQQGTNNGIVVLISAMSGPAVVPVYSTLRTLTNLWTNVTNVLTTPLLPDVVRLHATGNGEKLISVNGVHWVMVGTFVNFGILATYPLIAPVYNYWTAHAITLNKPLLCVLLAGISLFNMGAMMNTYLNGINRRSAVLAVAFLRGFSSIVIGAILMKYTGILGLGIGVWIGELTALTTLTYFFFKSVQKITHSKFCWNSLPPALFGVLFVHIFLFASLFTTTTNNTLLYIITILGVSLGAAWGWVRLDHETKVRIFKLINSKTSRYST